MCSVSVGLHGQPMPPSLRLTEGSDLIFSGTVKVDPEVL